MDYGSNLGQRWAIPTPESESELAPYFTKLEPESESESTFFPYWNRSRNRNQNNGPESEPESCIMVSVFYQVILALQNEGDIKYHEVYQLIWNRNRNRNRSQNSWNQNRNLSHVIIFKWSRNRSRNQSARVESESEPGPSGTAHLWSRVTQEMGSFMELNNYIRLKQRTHF